MVQDTCSIDGCGTAIYGRGWCAFHYRKWYKHGDPLWVKQRICSVDGCDKAISGRGWCIKHYRRWSKYGDPLRERPTNIERYWSKIDVRGPNECWPWTGSSNAFGYGYLQVEGTSVRASRFGYSQLVLDGQPIPDGLNVCHHCDQPSCMNPKHWFLGTQLANMTDQIAKGRDVHLYGEDHANAKLTEDDVREIRSRYAAGGITQGDLAREYGMHHSGISLIICRKNWRHVE